MNQNLLSRVLEFLRRKMWSKRWQRAVTCFAALVVFCVTYALILPAITMTVKYPVLSAETLTAWTGDELTVRVSAETEPEDGGKTVVLTLEGEGADLSDKYVFNDEGVCVILDEEENEILLHRAIREDAKNTVDYWFDMEPGTKTVFALDLADKVDVTRFAETMEAVKQSGEEAKPEAQKATAADAGKSAAVTEEAKTASSSNASRTEKVSAAATASGSNADIEAVNQEAKTSEEKVLAESHDNGFVEILDGQVMNDLEEQENEEATEIVAEMKVSAGIGGDYEKAVADAERNADKRGDAQLKLRWRDIVAKAAAAPELVSYINGAAIAVFYDEEAMIPEGAELYVEEIEEGSGEYEMYLAQTRSAFADAAGGDASRTVSRARFFDITILDADGNEVEPGAPVKVVVSYDEGIQVSEDGGMNVVHFGEDQPEVFEPASVEGGQDVKGLSFTTDSFSVFGFFGTETLTARVLTADGETYTITVSYGPEAGIPKTAALYAREVVEETEYKSLLTQAEEEVQKQDENYSISSARFFDIEIRDGGTVIEPEDTVDVTISYDDPVQLESGEVMSAVHFAEEGIDLTEVRPVAAKAGGTEVTFRQDSFSMTGTLIINVAAGRVENGCYMILYQDGSTYYALSNTGAKVVVTPNADGEFENVPDNLIWNKNGNNWRGNHGNGNYLNLNQNGSFLSPTSPGISFRHFRPTGESYVRYNFYYGSANANRKNLYFSSGQFSVATGYDPNDEPYAIFQLAKVRSLPQQEVTHVPPVADESKVHKEGNLDTFLSNLPYGTVYIDYDLMRMDAYDWNGTEGTHKTESGVQCSVDLGSGYKLGYNPGGYDPSAVNGSFGVMYDNLTLAPGEKRQFSEVATVRFTNVAYLSDGTKADVLVTITNATIQNTDSIDRSPDLALYLGNDLLPAASNQQNIGLSQRLWGEFDFNIKIVPSEARTTGDLTGKIFLYGMDDYDIDNRNRVRTEENEWNIFTETYDSSGSLVMVPIKTNGTQTTVSGYGEVQLGEGGSGTGYLKDGGTETLTRHVSFETSEDEKRIPIYRSLNEYYEPVDQLYYVSDPAGSDTVPKFTTEVTAWPAYATYKHAVYHHDSDGDGEFRFWLYSTEPSVDESVTLHDDGGILTKLYMPETSCLFIDGYDLHGTRSDNDTLNSGYFLIADANQGLSFTARCQGQANSHLRNSDMIYKLYSRTWEGGTISTNDTDVHGDKTAYGVHQPGGSGPDKHSDAMLAVPKNKTAVYEMIPDTNWHIWKVEIADGTQDFTSGEIDLREVTWDEDGNYTVTGANGTVYTFHKDANNVVTYTFANIDRDHWITVWWEPDHPQSTITVIKNWEDNGNARQSRPDDIIAYVIRSDGGRVNPTTDETAKTILKTGEDPNTSGSTAWIKNDVLNRWEYTFAVYEETLPADVVFKGYEDTVSDYTGDAVGAEKAKTAVIVSYDTVTKNTRYKVEITNTLKDGGISFQKKDQFGFPVAGADFRLYTDADCTKPEPAPAEYLATSGADGTVTFTGISCGMYYMKETNVPTYGDNKPYGDKRSQVYRVIIHKDPTASTITPGTVKDHIFTPDPAGPVPYIENPKPLGEVSVKKTVEGDEAARAQYFDFVMEFPAQMAGKTIRVNALDEILPGASGDKVLYKFRLKNGPWGILFSNLPDDMPYRVKELKLDNFTTSVAIEPTPPDGMFTDGEEDGYAYVSGKIDADQRYTITYTNTQRPDIMIRKTDSGEAPKSLAGSKFKLYKYNETDQRFDPLGEEFVIPAEGKPWEHLEPGLYKLEEVMAPAGYVIVHKETEFTVQIPTPNDSSYIAVSSGVTWAAVIDDSTIAIRNQAGVELPATGGPGTRIFTLSGVLMILASALLYGFRMRHGERRTA